MKCGNSIMGCGGEFNDAAPAYRCIDCDVSMHRDCLRRHCKDDLAAANAANDALRAENERLVAALQTVAVFVNTDKYAARENVLSYIRAALNP